MQTYRARDNAPPPTTNVTPHVVAPLYAERGPQDKVLVFQIAEDCEARTVFKGPVTLEALDLFIDYLNVYKKAFPKKAALKPEQTPAQGQSGPEQSEPVA